MKKLTFLEWNEDPKVFIGNSLKPATISNVVINNEETKEATIVVPNDQLSLAIGKSGQNVRLAVKLTNWKLDITSETDESKTENKSGTTQTLEEKNQKTSSQIQKPIQMKMKQTHLNLNHNPIKAN